MVSVVDLFSWEEYHRQVELVEFLSRVLSVVLNSITVFIIDFSLSESSWLTLELKGNKIVWALHLADEVRDLCARLKEIFGGRSLNVLWFSVDVVEGQIAL